MKLALIFAGLALLLASTNDAAAQAPQHLGGCTVLNMRSNGSPPADLSSICLHYQDWGNRDFFTPPIELAFDTAEPLACGHSGCVTSATNARVVIVNDATINGWVLSDPGVHRIDIFLTVGLLDFADGTTASLTQQLIDATGQSNKPGIVNVLTALHTRSGEVCAAGMPRPPKPDLTAVGVTDEQLYTMQMSGDAGILTFVFLHEFAHLLSGGPCGVTTGSIMQIENACDQGARGWFFKGEVAPTDVYSWMAIIGSYQALEGPLLASQAGFAGGGAGSFRQMFPASDWKSRANALATDWKAKCQSSPATGVCAGFALQAQVASQIANVPIPTACHLP